MHKLQPITSYAQLHEALKVGRVVIHYSDYWRKWDQVHSISDTFPGAHWVEVRDMHHADTSIRRHCTDLFGKGDRTFALMSDDQG